MPSPSRRLLSRTTWACVSSAAPWLLGCHRGATDSTGAAPVASRVATARPAPVAYPTLTAALAAADLRVEARRGLTSAADPALARHRAELEAHFGKPVPSEIAFQVAAVEPNRRAVLLQATRQATPQSAQGEGRPLVWLLDAKGEIIWAKAHPIGGVKPGVREPSLASAPDGHVCLAWCNASSAGDGYSVALRRWADDGGAFADYDALHVDSCDALSVLYWPRRGWVFAVAQATGATLELVTENGTRGWGEDGMSLPWTFRTPATLALALDTLDSMLLFRLGQSGGPGSSEYIFASRWSPDGRPLWPGPLSVKKLPGKLTDPLARLVLEPTTDDAILATLPGAATELGENVVVAVASDGAVVRR